jgi:hypothetical protein
MFEMKVYDTRGTRILCTGIIGRLCTEHRVWEQVRLGSSYVHDESDLYWVLLSETLGQTT